MKYRITPLHNKSIIETRTWRKGKHEILSVQVWSRGWVEIDEKPDLSDYDPDIGLIVSDVYNVGEVNFSGDGGSDMTYSQSMSNAAIRKVEKIIEDEGEFALEDAGWIDWGVETQLLGPLEIEKVRK